ncbi:Fungal Zn(2)-Cys(6) binuclear cluster domain-containing protein [Penicillium ucsense]|uniref:Fungal Zn(2)-Cys(6) binuclear cluster domain-containing protein n=1 Tax=Penicillium ucsense TaxID=2839758 RepID=A0A8J8W8U9_9EURO|nr:Fungal Zn(2)-Cys(6) binuclear cluster domain-containing protein [Penicillium ucsense]KAF7733609.1 Fungal Zn(2)-Cys(6) binuclear cluster domain-containing protein [Penicillium ucsense]
MEVRNAGAPVKAETSPDLPSPTQPPSVDSPCPSPSAPTATTITSSSHTKRPASEPAPPRKRVRRWHHRGFTGCSTCRRRHVRCDEAAPTCKNCTRLGLECDGLQGRMTFKVYGPTPTSQTSRLSGQSRGKQSNPESSPDSSSESCGSGAGVTVKSETVDDCETSGVSLTTLPQLKDQTRFHFQQPVRPSNLRSVTLRCTDEQYFGHFVSQVSSLLIVHETALKVNPYRSCFPDLARSSPSMTAAMQALGALHLANTSYGNERLGHFETAIGKYGQVMTTVRDCQTFPNGKIRIQDLATCLLLCLFEMMDSQHQNWEIHLKGAREMCNLLFCPRSDKLSSEGQCIDDVHHPLRSFLLSLLSSLDVAGACARPGDTVATRSYWKTLEGGWEYNFGIPSLSTTTPPDDPRLLELRKAWSRMMEVRAIISTFARDKARLSPDQQDIVYRRIFHQLAAWRQTTPIPLQALGEMELHHERLDAFPDPDMLEYYGCVEAYEKATLVHLHQIAGAGRPNWITDRAYLDSLITRIVTLIRRLTTDVGQLAFLWPLFIAGRETRKAEEQQYVQRTLHELKRFGFRNVDKALELLEGIWLKRRAFPEGWTETLEELRTNILLP